VTSENRITFKDHTPGGTLPFENSGFVNYSLINEESALILNGIDQCASREALDFRGGDTKGSVYVRCLVRGESLSTSTFYVTEDFIDIVEHNPTDTENSFPRSPPYDETEFTVGGSLREAGEITGFQNKAGTLFAASDNSVNDDRLGRGIADPGGTLRFQVNNDRTLQIYHILDNQPGVPTVQEEILRTTSQIPLNTVLSILFTSDGTKWSIYVNGELQPVEIPVLQEDAAPNPATDTITELTRAGVIAVKGAPKGTNSGDWFGDIVGTTSNITIGCDQNNPSEPESPETQLMGFAGPKNFFNGEIYEVAVYDEDLGEAGAETLTTEGVDESHPDIQHCWKATSEGCGLGILRDTCGGLDLFFANQTSVSYEDVDIISEGDEARVVVNDLDVGDIRDDIEVGCFMSTIGSDETYEVIGFVEGSEDKEFLILSTEILDALLDLTGVTIEVVCTPEPQTIQPPTCNFPEFHDTGRLIVNPRALIKVTDDSLTDIRDVADIGCQVTLGVVPQDQYSLLNFVDGEPKQFHILSTAFLDALLNVDCTTITISCGTTPALPPAAPPAFATELPPPTVAPPQTILTAPPKPNADFIGGARIGNLAFRGQKLVTDTDFEALFGIMNGSNPPAISTEDNLYMENFLILITTDPGGPNETENYYAIREWDGQNITIAGQFEDWGVTSPSTVDIEFYQFTKTPDVTIPEGKFATQPEHTFQYLDRRGNEVITIDSDTGASMMSMELLASGLNNRDGTLDIVGQIEDISMIIERRTPKDANEQE
jgi:hypothetical protein